MTQLPNTNILSATPAQQAATGTTHIDPQGRLGMPVPDPAAPPFPQVHHAFSNDVDFPFCLRHDSITIEMVDGSEEEEPSSQETVSEDEDTTDRVQHFSDPPSHPQEGSQSTNTQTRNTRRGPNINTSHPRAFRAQPFPFFQGASNFSITGCPSFNVIEGNAYFNAGAATTVGNGHPNSRASNHISFDGSGISFGTNWPFGPNNNPFAPGSQPAGSSTSRAQRRSPTSMGTSARSSDSRRSDHEDNMKTSHYSNTSDDNTFAPYGGDRFGNGASGFALSGGSFITVNGVTVKHDPGVLRPLRK